MNGEIISRILEIEREQLKRAAKDNLAVYNRGKKVHKKQLAFHRCKKRNRWVFGGNRTGKTECGAAEAVMMARGNHPFRQNKKDVSGWVVSVSQQVQREVAQAKILHYLSPAHIEDVVMQSGKKGACAYDIIDYILVRNVFGGVSKIAFKSCDQGREKFQGASLDFVWFDEEPPKDVYEECRMRVLDRRGDIFGTMTPLKGLTFLYDEIYLNKSGSPEIWHITMQWEDNPFLSKAEIRALSSEMSDEQLSMRKFGRFHTGMGLVYPEFDERVHVIAPFSVPKEWYDNISIDPGLKNPLSCHFYACDFDGNVYVIAEHYEAEKDVAYHSEKILGLSKRLNWHTDGRGRISALIDSAASQRTLASSKSVCELFFDNGILVNPNVDKDIFAGISRVKAYLKPSTGPPRLFIFKNCVNLIREIKSYWWGEGDRPVKSGDHALDELRYYIMSRPVPAKFQPHKTEVQKHKEKLAKKLRHKSGEKL